MQVLKSYKLIKIYKQGAAILLLLLFIFISTPVQYWHRHNDRFSNASNNSHKPISAIKDDCRICAHSYSVYSADIFISEIAAYISPTIFNQYDHSYRYAISYPALINKGPPHYYLHS